MALPVARMDGHVVPKALILGISTGGPAALDVLIPALPGNFPCPILLVQHMPQLFTRLLAERLDQRSQLHVVEAADGESVLAGHVYIAPGDRHMEVVQASAQASGNHASARIHITQGPPENHCRPAVDVLFRSAVKLYGRSLLAVIMTGMGYDGLEGCRAVRSAGGLVYAQNSETSAVWGMPGAVTTAGLADRVLPLNGIAAEILRAIPAGESHGLQRSKEMAG
jgi:two-component system chemotaxis response regulator CheB